MRRFAMVVSALTLAACAKKDEPTATPPAVMAAAPMNLAAVAGTWNFTVTNVAGDSVLTTYTLVATADTAGWTMTLPNRPALPLKLTVSGDSVMAAAPEYESVLKKGVKVTTNTTFHLVGDTMMTSTIAHYTVAGPDSMRMLRGKGVRAPK